LIGLWLQKKGKLYENKWFHRFALFMGPSGFIALLAGWFTTEVGRQPWVVYGVMTNQRCAFSCFSRSGRLTLIILSWCIACIWYRHLLHAETHAQRT
jgi:cytochrome d ubiquinol oxidase subunit I